MPTLKLHKEAKRHIVAHVFIRLADITIQETDGETNMNINIKDIDKLPAISRRKISRLIKKGEKFEDNKILYLPVNPRLQ